VKFYSQHGQDRFLLANFFCARRGGVFVDIGADDGETFSNTLFFERAMGWTGLCVEPLPSAFAKLKLTRRAICEQVCVSDFDGEAEFMEGEAGVDKKMLRGLSQNVDARHIDSASSRIRQRVPVTRLATLLARHSLFDIDYCSIDSEGSELSILSELDLNRFRVAVFTVERNCEDDERLAKIMTQKGYEFVASGMQNRIFKRRDVKRRPQISVICAVPHDELARDQLLRGHAANLARQTVPIEPIYVFDGGGGVPDWLAGRALSVGETLTRHQAWNVALSVVGTPMVMNLNLKDRLAPDAAEVLERELLQSDAMAACGDWKTCHTEAEADEVEPCYPADRLPIESAPGMPRRLGSSVEGYESFGPAALWRLEAHLRAPRYPWRLRDGTLLHDAADLAWQTIFIGMLRQKIVRIPMILGNCRELANRAGSPLPYDERPLLRDPGISVL
jgi:FkbM family methyltransferase